MWSRERRRCLAPSLQRAIPAGGDKCSIPFCRDPQSAIPQSAILHRRQVQYPLLSGSGPSQRAAMQAAVLRSAGNVQCSTVQPTHHQSLPFEPLYRHGGTPPRMGAHGSVTPCARAHASVRDLTGVTAASRASQNHRDIEGDHDPSNMYVHAHVHNMYMSTSMYMSMSTSMYMDMSMSMSMWRAATAAAPSKLRRTSRMCLLRLGALEQLDVPD